MGGDVSSHREVIQFLAAVVFTTNPASGIRSSPVLSAVGLWGSGYWTESLDFKEADADAA